MRADLSEEAGFFLDLVDNPPAWRERLVSELKFGGRNHVRSISSYQVDFPPALLEAHVDLKKCRSANVLLPLTTRSKRPLLNFALAGPGGAPATLTSRASVAALQAGYLSALAETSIASSDLVASIEFDLLEAICGFSPGFFTDTFLKDGAGDFSSALAGYLSGGLHLDVRASDVARWQTKTAEVGRILSARLAEPPEPVSSSEEVLLALPRMGNPPQSTEEIEDLVQRFCEGVRAAESASDHAFLTVLAEYGRRYEMVVEVEVSLLEPVRIKIEEDLPLELKRRRFRNWVDQDFSLGDARSAHLEARVDDPNVEISRYRVRDLKGGDATGWLESIRHTREALAIYSSEAERPHYLRVSVCLTVARHLLVGACLLCLINFMAIAAVPAIGFSGAGGERLALLAIPTTVAATFVLAREQTALATRLQWVPRAILAMTTFVLWAEIVIGLIVAGPDPLEKESPVSRPVNPTGLSRSIAPRGTMDRTKERGNG